MTEYFAQLFSLALKLAISAFKNAHIDAYVQIFCLKLTNFRANLYSY